MLERNHQLIVDIGAFIRLSHDEAKRCWNATRMIIVHRVKIQIFHNLAGSSNQLVFFELL